MGQSSSCGSRIPPMCQPMHALMAKPRSREKKKSTIFKALGVLGLEITSSYLFAKISKSPVQI